MNSVIRNLYHRSCIKVRDCNQNRNHRIRSTKYILKSAVVLHPLHPAPVEIRTLSGGISEISSERERERERVQLQNAGNIFCEPPQTVCLQSDIISNSRQNFRKFSFKCSSGSHGYSSTLRRTVRGSWVTCKHLEDFSEDFQEDCLEDFKKSVQNSEYF